MIILGIESSCDETGVAVYCGSRGILGEALYSQVSLHQDYGGVVPELASRDHVRKVIPLINSALDSADLRLADIDGVAYTAGPGLVGALLVGASVAHSIAFAQQMPVVGVHHMEGHLLAPMLADRAPEPPFVALLVSGGHTQLVKVSSIGDYTILGESVDDAAGEAFDKTAKLLGLGYPGGPKVAERAEKGEPGVYRFPRPMTDRPGLDFSFSGLKTFAANTFAQCDGKEQTINNICFAFQEAVVDTLMIKCRRALKEANADRLVIAGGVSANKQLRETLAKALDAQVYYPPHQYCTDNGAMIALAGYYRLKSGQKESNQIWVKPRWPISALKPLA